MNLRGRCAALAATLSSQYSTYQEYQPSENLNRYLDENGLLVSMCSHAKGLGPLFRYECEPNKRDKILPASWIQKNQTGIRVSHVPQLPTGVGMVVDPLAVDIQCLFPADGDSALRDDSISNGSVAKGCGPVAVDPHYGSKGFDRLPKWKQVFERAFWNEYAQRNFQNDPNVSCTDFFFQNDDGPRKLETMMYLRDLNPDICFDEFSYRNYIQILVDDVEYKVQHKVCQDSNSSKLHRNNWFIYWGRCSYQPSEFEAMMDTMKRLNEQMAQNWNEVVLDRPETLKDVIQAIFYVEWPFNPHNQYPNAVRQAKKMEKHLLKLHWKDDKPLFHCNISAPELASVNAE